MKQKYNKVIDAVENFYKPIVAEKGGSLVVNRLWKNGKVNASATLSLIGKKWIVNMYGGLARYQGVTADGFAMVMCHEVGHHLAGFPMNDPAPLTRWESSNEGQSDYFASMKCFRSVYGNDTKIKPLWMRCRCQRLFQSNARFNIKAHQKSLYANVHQWRDWCLQMYWRHLENLKPLILQNPIQQRSLVLTMHILKLNAAWIRILMAQSAEYHTPKTLAGKRLHRVLVL